MIDQWVFIKVFLQIQFFVVAKLPIFSEKQTPYIELLVKNNMSDYLAKNIYFNLLMHKTLKYGHTLQNVSIRHSSTNNLEISCVQKSRLNKQMLAILVTLETFENERAASTLLHFMNNNPIKLGTHFVTAVTVSEELHLQ